jgi:hypothetical protein
MSLVSVLLKADSQLEALALKRLSVRGSWVVVQLMGLLPEMVHHASKNSRR